MPSCVQLVRDKEIRLHKPHKVYSLCSMIESKILIVFALFASAFPFDVALCRSLGARLTNLKWCVFFNRSEQIEIDWKTNFCGRCVENKLLWWRFFDEAVAIWLNTNQFIISIVRAMLTEKGLPCGMQKWRETRKYTYLQYIDVQTSGLLLSSLSTSNEGFYRKKCLPRASRGFVSCMFVWHSSDALVRKHRKHYDHDGLCAAAESPLCVYKQ